MQQQFPHLSVNPFIGTSGTGHTFPGAVAPFGRVQLSPETFTGGTGWKYCAGAFVPRGFAVERLTDGANG